METIAYRLRPLILLAASCMVAACDRPTSASPEPLLRVDSVEVLVPPSFPTQATAHVQGFLPTPCYAVGRTEQRREGSNISVTITVKPPAVEVLCAQVIEPVRESVSLSGPFPPGDYVVRVNGVERAFRIPSHQG